MVVGRGGGGENVPARRVLPRGREPGRRSRDSRVEMATGARLGGLAAGHHRFQADAAAHPFPTATISVGQDDWAHQVINNVLSERPPPPVTWLAPQRPSPVTAVAPPPPPSVSVQQQQQVERQERVREWVLEKKRLFHSQRRLELKNLPDGCTEQVKRQSILYFV